MNLVIYKALILFFVTACSSVDFGCEDASCFSNEFCRMVTVDCFTEPCPELPMCVSSATLCVGTTPYIDSRGAIVECVDSSQCNNTGLDCVEGYCCAVVAKAMPSRGPELNNSQHSEKFDDNVPPPIFNNDLFGSNEKKDDGPTGIPCKTCDLKICFIAECRKYPTAKCIEDNCTCEAWFEDADGTRVTCFPDSDLPFPFDEEKTTVKPSTTMTGTSQSVHEEKKDASWIYALCAIGAVVVVCIITYVLYKFRTVEMNKRKNDINGKDAEQKAPLSKTSSENNNELKPIHPLVNGQSTTTSEDV